MLRFCGYGLRIADRLSRIVYRGSCIRGGEGDRRVISALPLPSPSPLSLFCRVGFLRASIVPRSGTSLECRWYVVVVRHGERADDRTAAVM